jgi:hypothetical protein
LGDIHLLRGLVKPQASLQIETSLLSVRLQYQRHESNGICFMPLKSSKLTRISFLVVVYAGGLGPSLIAYPRKEGVQGEAAQYVAGAKRNR